MLVRRNLLDHREAGYVLCQTGAKEHADHLFFQRAFASQCWNLLNIQWSFMEICIVAMWKVWKIRNRTIFYGHAASFNLWIVRFKEELRLQSLRFKEARKIEVLSWIDLL
ncbi:hypothetical protein BS78_09G104500 [Paspalum vaginatum]|nr:hypothetical protein BS78_09G104500 [Paspalum vaginatum]